MGYGTLILNDGEIEQEYYGKVPLRCHGIILQQSNNVAELFAIYKSLRLFPGCLNIHTDSLYCINVLHGYEASANIEFIEKIKGMLQEREVIFTHVYGHQDNDFNNRVDELATMGRLDL